MSIDERLQALVTKYERSPDDVGRRRSTGSLPDHLTDLRAQLAAVQQRLAAAEAMAEAAEVKAAAAEARARDALRAVEWLARADETPTSRPRTA